MDNCNEFLELISAYADGEISDADKKAAQVHLETCKSCSAFLELYKEISVAASEAMVTPPPALRIGVMERVLREKKDHVRPIVYFKRYLPAVACLAIILLALPWVISNRQIPAESSYTGTTAAPDAFLTAGVPESLTEESGAGGSNGQSEAGAGFGGRIFLHDAATQAAPASPPPISSPFSADIADARGSEDVTAAPRAPVSGPFQWAETEAQEEMPDVMPDIAQTPEISAHAGITGAPEADAMPLPTDESGFLRTFNELISEAYVWIEIEGELPESLGMLEAEPLGEWSVWDRMYKIPVAEAQTLLAELSQSEDIQITFGDRNSDYAIVLFAYR